MSSAASSSSSRPVVGVGVGVGNLDFDLVVFDFTSSTWSDFLAEPFFDLDSDQFAFVFVMVFVMVFVLSVCGSTPTRHFFAALACCRCCFFVLIVMTFGGSDGCFLLIRLKKPRLVVLLRGLSLSLSWLLSREEIFLVPLSECFAVSLVLERVQKCFARCIRPGFGWAHSASFAVAVAATACFFLDCFRGWAVLVVGCALSACFLALALALVLALAWMPVPVRCFRLRKGDPMPAPFLEVLRLRARRSSLRTGRYVLACSAFHSFLCTHRSWR
mmetsp:Transcript_1443/g.3693  ORF Transcript_1443/g.3693 Transcript_1443/m.3693 type:complete len:273 (+) Transcript_1443:509-1327(+)